jgi:PAS domain S-box-containing protein
MLGFLIGRVYSIFRAKPLMQVDNYNVSLGWLLLQDARRSAILVLGTHLHHRQETSPEGPSECVFMVESVGKMRNTAASGSQPRILLVDGHRSIRNYLTRLLSEHYEIDAAADASTTLSLARKRAPDLVIADVTMRALRDFDLLCQFHSDEWGRVPILLYSTPPRDGASCVNIFEAAGKGYIITPVSALQFLALVRSELRASQLRRESNYRLHLSKERFRTLKTMTPGLWVKAFTGEVISELPEWWEKLTGQTREEYAGFGYLDVVHPIDKPHVLKAEQAALKSKTTYQIDFRVRQRNGSYSHVRTNGAPVCDDDGNVREWVGSMINIDEDRRAEEALRASEERHRTFNAMTALAVWNAEPSGEIVTDVYGWSELTGQTRDQYQGSGWLEALHPEDKARVLEDWQHALRDTASIDAEYRVRRKDGTYAYVRDQGIPLRRPDGSVREWIGTVTDIDKRKTVEEALRISEERYRTLTTATTSAIWNATASGEIVGECHGWENMTGQTPQQYRGWGWMELVHPDDKDRTIEIWQRSLRNAIPVDVCYRNRRRDGSYGYVRAQGAPVCNPDGSVREWIGTLVDIDDQKRAEEALRTSHEEFRADFELAGIGQVETDPKTGRYVRVNDKFCEMVGYSADELLTMTYLDITHPDDRQASMSSLLSLLRGEINKFTTEKRYVRKDGSVLWGLANSTLIHDAHSRPLRTITMIEDVTERRQSEALSQCQKRALEMLAKGASLTEVLDFVIIAVERQATVDLRGSIQILDEEGKQFRLCAAPSLPESYRQAVLQNRPVIAGNLTTVPEWADTANLLAPYPIRSIWATPIISSNQRPLGSFWLCSAKPRTPGTSEQTMIENVTQTIALAIERKEAEAEHEKLLIREQAAREQAEGANRLKDEFLAVVSHELRTPLNAINGWVFMLLHRTLDDAAQLRALQSIQRQVHSQCQLIDDLLDVARIVSGKLRLELCDVDLSKVIAAALDVVRPAAEAKQIDLVAELDRAASVVWADSERLQQVIWNLLSNAVKFTPDGGRVVIQSRRTASGIEIVVADTGQGIGADFLPYVFDRFRQADVSSTRTQGGLGLGLAIVRHLIELHGGTVLAASPGKGKGATFTVRLPLRAVRTSSSKGGGRKQERGALVDITAEDREMLKGLRVLVVEDNLDDREVLFAELAQQGAMVSASASAAEALSGLDEFRPDVLVADIAMPGEDGYSLIRKIRASPLDHGGLTPAIALTAYAGDANRKRALEAGFQKHMTKPADPDELARTILRLARG